MNKRTPEQWQTLFAAQKASGLSQAQFCKREGLCPKYFSLRRRQLAQETISTKVSSPLITVQPPVSSRGSVSLHYKGIDIRFADPNPSLIAAVVKQLA